MFGRESRQVGFVGMATTKLNKEKLKRMKEQKDEVGINLGKRWKPDSSSKKPVEESFPRPPVAQGPITIEQAPASSVELVEPLSAPSSSRAIEKVPTLPKDASLALRRAKSVVTKDDIDEYAKLNTDVVKRALAHSLMKVFFFFFFAFLQGLTEVMVIANRCMLWEDGLVKLKAQMSEAAEANQTLMTVSNDLTQERDRKENELTLLRGDMAAKDAELKKVLDENVRITKRLRELTDQVGTIKASVVEEFKSSEAYDDNNTKYFLAGFELLRKKAKEKYPDLDFDVFQLYKDDDLVMPAKGGNEGMTSTDPQLDDDATT
jgi:Skp family chaperone for outer membrane proteins